MNYRQIASQLGMLLLLFAAAIGAVGFFAVSEHFGGRRHEALSAMAFLTTAAAAAALGGLLRRLSRRRRVQLGRRDATFLVVVSWVLGGVIGAVPFAIFGRLVETTFPEQAFRSLASCLFESVSGLTTCGASVLTDIEAMPRSILLWRALTQWIGGLGIVVLFVAVLPSIGAAGKRMFLAESTGVTPEGLRPQVRETARILWLIYLGLTIGAIVLLMFCGMNLFDAICHSFTTLSTGGFSTKNASIASYDSWGVDVVLITFMVLGGVNFALYYQLFRGRWRFVAKDAELRTYLAILAGGAAIVAVALVAAREPLTLVDGAARAPTAIEATRQATFVVVSMQTTTGFCMPDYDRWPAVAVGVIMLVSFIGGCGGSTSSGVKVIRMFIIAKLIWQEIEREFRPSVVRPLRAGSASIDPAARIGAATMLLAGVLLIAGGTVGVLALEAEDAMDVRTASSAVLVCLFNVGPGLGFVGPSLNYGWVDPETKVLLTGLMIVGRLEIFAVLAVMSRRFWRGV